MPKRIKWSKQMDRYLRCYYHRKSVKYLAERLGIKKSAVLRRARKLEIQSKREAGTALKALYREEEVVFIHDNIKQLGVAGVASKLNRTSEAVRRKANRLGLYTNSRNKPLSHSEQQIIKDNIETKTYRGIAKLLGRGEEETRWHARRLGLSRPVRSTKKPRQIS